MKYTKEQLEEMRDKLAMLTVECSDDETFYNVLLEGCRGYNNFEDDELIEEFEDAFGEDYFDDED